MTGAVLDRPRGVFAGTDAGAAEGGRVTLEERLDATLHLLLSAGEAACPVCDARMIRTAGGDGGECGGCGSRLA